MGARIPKEWLDLLEMIRENNSRFIGVQLGPTKMGALESMQGLRLIRTDEKGRISITSAGCAILDEERGSGILKLIGNRSKVLEEVRKRVVGREHRLRQRLQQERKVGQINFSNIFVVAKLWNSATPVFPPLDMPKFGRSIGGGGYILMWQDLCLCIDPGVNFLTRFYRRELSPKDIDGIIVTHDHFDHTCDIEGLLTLLFELKESGTARKVDFLASRGTLIKYNEMITRGVKGGYLNPICLQPGQSVVLPNWKGKIGLGVTRAFHWEYYSSCPVGLTFNLTSPRNQSTIFKIGITGDTRWSYELYADFAETNLLVAHLGSIEREDDRFLPWHLGAKGLSLLIKGIRPQLTIVSEFGEEIGNDRYELCKTLSEVTDCKVIPGELDMEISIPQMQCRMGAVEPFKPLNDFVNRMYERGYNNEDTAIY